MFIKYVPVSCQHYSHILMHGEPFPEGVLQNCGGGHVSLCPELHRNCSLWISHFWQLDHDRYFVVLWSGWMGHHCGFIDCHQDLHNLSYSPVLWQVLLYVSIFVKKKIRHETHITETNIYVVLLLQGNNITYMKNILRNKNVKYPVCLCWNSHPWFQSCTGLSMDRYL